MRNALGYILGLALSIWPTVVFAVEINPQMIIFAIAE